MSKRIVVQELPKNIIWCISPEGELVLNALFLPEFDELYELATERYYSEYEDPKLDWRHNIHN